MHQLQRKENALYWLYVHIPWPTFSWYQKQVNTEEYGPTLADLEKQIAAHNILHKEIEAYNSQLCVSSAGGKVNTDTHSHSRCQSAFKMFQAPLNICRSLFLGRIYCSEETIQQLDGELSWVACNTPFILS